MVTNSQSWPVICVWEAAIWLRKVLYCLANSWKSCYWFTALGCFWTAIHSFQEPGPSAPMPGFSTRCCVPRLSFSSARGWGRQTSTPYCSTFGPQITRPCQLDLVPDVGLFSTFLLSIHSHIHHPDPCAQPFYILLCYARGNAPQKLPFSLLGN